MGDSLSHLDDLLRHFTTKTPLVPAIVRLIFPTVSFKLFPRKKTKLNKREF